MNDHQFSSFMEAFRRHNELLSEIKEEMDIQNILLALGIRKDHMTGSEWRAFTAIIGKRANKYTDAYEKEMEKKNRDIRHEYEELIEKQKRNKQQEEQNEISAVDFLRKLRNVCVADSAGADKCADCQISATCRMLHNIKGFGDAAIEEIINNVTSAEKERSKNF